MQRGSELESEGIRVDWGVASGAGADREPDRPGGPLARARDPARRAKAARASSLAGTVRILEGHSARIATGETAALTTRHRRGTVTTLVPADSGLEAHARVLGDGRVLLELRPFEARFRGDGRIETAEAATTLTVEPGKTVVIAGLTRRAGSRQPGCPAGAESGSARATSACS